MSVQDYLIMKTCIFFLSLKENQQDEEVDFEACVVKYVGWFVCLFFEGGGSGDVLQGETSVKILFDEKFISQHMFFVAQDKSLNCTGQVCKT